MSSKGKTKGKVWEYFKRIQEKTEKVGHNSETGCLKLMNRMFKYVLKLYAISLIVKGTVTWGGVRT
jgi:hypothetical protein